VGKAIDRTRALLTGTRPSGGSSKGGDQAVPQSAP